jgi:thiamine-phosphate pyrophosphorylase
MTETAQIYLATPPQIDAAFPEALARVLDAVPVACLRLDLASRDEDRVTRAADACREVAHRVDVPLVLTGHPGLVGKLGLDGVHLTDPRGIRELRRDWGADPIVGAGCGTSRHAGMAAGEAGADYVAFGPVGGVPGPEGHAEAELFAWWSEMIELPVVAEGGLDRAAIERLAPVTDFLCLGEEVWGALDAGDDPAARLRDLTAPLR